MMNCRQISRLVSQSLDARLPWRQRVAIRIHLLYCVWCRRYAAQLDFLHRAGKELKAETLADPADKLPTDAKEKMQSRLRDALKDLPPSGQ